MASPAWNTAAGNIGTYAEGAPVAYTFSVIPVSVTDTLTYVLLNGRLPTGLTLSTSGTITGTLAEVNIDTTSEFTVRVTETSGATFIGLADRTFTMLVQGPDAPYFDTLQPYLPVSAVPDSTWQSIQMLVTNPDPNTSTIITLDSGTLPTGLEIDGAGLIRGYAKPPVTSTGLPTTTTYAFTLRVTTTGGSSTSTYSIDVENQELTVGFVGRNPAILNDQPLTYIISESDPYYSYYFTGSSLGRFVQDNQFIFKMVGYNFDTDSTDDPYTNDLTYTVTGLSSGSVLVTDAFKLTPALINGTGIYGWINGALNNIGPDVNTYSFTVQAARTSNPTLVSTAKTFTFIVVGSIDDTITWTTNSFSTDPAVTNLGIMDNGAISDLKITAIFGQGVTDGAYRIVSGTLPAGLQLLADGNIIGRVDFKTTFGKYTFTVEAYSPSNIEVSSTREFTLTINEQYTTPYDDIYMKALLAPADKIRIDALLANILANQSSNIYRIVDPYFGLAKDIRYQHMFGVPSISVLNPTNSADDAYFYTLYTQAIQENFYWRQVTMGDLKTAVAKDIDGKIIYEVVYCQLVDDLVNPVGQSVSKQVVWPRPITGTGVTENQLVYPNSLPNMRQQIADMLGQINDATLLPRWMDSQQADGNVLGFVPCWVICYTLPGTAATVLASITNYLATNSVTSSPLRALNQVTFELDRFEVDRSLTYTWGSTTPDQWPPAPNSASVNNDSKDSFLFFPRKTILTP